MTIKQRMVCLLCAGLLASTCAGARADMDTAYTTADASTVWQSNSGKMQIYLMDTQLLRPAVDTLYFMDVTPRRFSKEELLRVLRVFQPEATSISGDYSEPFKDYMQLEEKNDLLTLIASGTRDNGTWSEVRVRCTLNNSTYLTGDMQRLQRIHRGNAQHCRYTLEEARAMADTAAAAIAHDYAYSVWGFIELYPRDGSDCGHDDYDYIEGYSFCYTPVMAGIQVLYTPDENEADSLTLLPVRLPRLYIKVMDSGLYEIVWEGAQDVDSKTPVEALLPDNQILDIARSLLPLANMSVEQSLGDDAALVVESIRLSYCRVQRRDKPGQYVMIPVWDFFGDQAQEQADGTLTLLTCTPNDVLLTLNAMDGTVIDRRYGY